MCFHPICLFKLVLQLKKGPQTTQEEQFNSRVFLDLLYLASDAIDIKFTANVVANVYRCRTVTFVVQNYKIKTN